MPPGGPSRLPLGKTSHPAGNSKQVVGVESRMRGDVLVRFGEDSAYTDLVDWWKGFTLYSKYAFSGAL